MEWNLWDTKHLKRKNEIFMISFTLKDIRYKEKFVFASYIHMYIDLKIMVIPGLTHLKAMVTLKNVMKLGFL